MKQINVLIVVDVEGALASGDLGANVYLVDTNKHFSSGSEGQQELITACTDGQVVIWSVTPVDPGTDATIVAFSGQMIAQNVCVPVKSTEPGGGGVIWSGRVETQGVAAAYQYSCVLSFDGNQMTFDPYLNVKAAN